MDEPGAHELTELLLAWGNGDEEALARIAPLVHAELYRLAKRYMSKERPDHLLQTSALINEAYVRLIDWKAVRWQNRTHFFGVAAQMMRRILARRPIHLLLSLHNGKRHLVAGHSIVSSSKRGSARIRVHPRLKTLT